MGTIGIAAVALNSKGERYDSYHSPPEVNDFIASVQPASAGRYSEDRRLFIIETGKGSVTVTAAAHVAVPPRELPVDLKAPFSYWLTLPNPFQQSPDVTRELQLVFGPEDFGLVGLWFGARRPAIRWPGFELKEVDRWIDLLMSHSPR